MEWINKYVFGAGVPLLLFGVAILLFIMLSGKPLLNPVIMLRGMFKKKSGGGVSPIKAVLLALAGTLGVGNIVGVASAIALGGAGAVFWMWISALFAMMLKYAEVALAVSHRRRREGENFGGAMYYMKDMLTAENRCGLALIFSGAFALFCIINAYSLGCVIQSNAVSDAFSGIMSAPRGAVGAIVALLCAAVFFGKGKKIFTVASSLVPIVSAIYMVMSLIVIAEGIDRIPDVFAEIFQSAFSIDSAAGGVAGFLLSGGLRYGTIRGLFSNEAGCGTAPIAHASADTDSPAEQGFLGIFEVFVDTIVLCTMTALVILLNFDAVSELSASPIMMTFSAFSAVLGEASELLLCISVLLFAFATIICWGYYGKECIYFFSKKKIYQNIYFSVYCVLVFAGAIMPMDRVWGIADFAIGAMTFMNMFAIFKMRGEIKDITLAYFKKHKKTGNRTKKKIKDFHT